MTILKIKLKNYKRFIDSEIEFNKDRNILIGENGVGKSSILTAIHQVLSGSFTSIESEGFESLFNTQIIMEFMEGEKKYADLPKLLVELYIDDDVDNSNINGIHNTDNKALNGLKMKIEPNENLSEEIARSLSNTEIFPFEYYKMEFKTFADRSYNSYSKYKGFIKHSILDSTRVSSKYAIKDYIGKMYINQSDAPKRQKINNAYRHTTHLFSENLYNDYGLTESEDGYKIALNNQGENSFQDNITIKKNGIDINYMGQGEKIFINTNYSLTNAPEDLNIVLIEEPENHLSYVNMHKLIDKIISTDGKQTFITTHSNMITSRLDLINAIFISDEGHTNLSKLTKDTSYFFQKSPDTNVLNYILSKKAILVEGDAEYILLDSFYSHLYQAKLYTDDLTLIACGGKTFKRYIELAKILNKKTVIITDNDKDYNKNITENYAELLDDNVAVFSDNDDLLHTFEVVLHEKNTEYLKEKMENGHMRNGVLSFMLENKAEAAFRLLRILENEYGDFIIPNYIKDAFEWIK